VIAARQKDCLFDLLEVTGWPYHRVAGRGRGVVGTIRQRLTGAAAVLRLARTHEVDFLLGTSEAIGPVGRMLGAISLVYNEDDAAVVRPFVRLAYPPATYVVTPACLAFEAYGRKHLTYRGYHELAYLHPARFTPDDSIRDRLGVPAGRRLFIVRMVALDAYHDAGARGIEPDRLAELLGVLGACGEVFVSAEAEAPPAGTRAVPLGPEHMHDCLAAADLVVCDSQTMAAEAAVLGTPVIRCNSFVGRISYLRELEQRWHLAAAFRPAQWPQLISTVRAWLADPSLKRTWQARRRRMLAASVDLTAWLLALLERLARRRVAGRSRDTDGRARLENRRPALASADGLG
jgi:predicted glycosyltransferase